MFTSGFKHRLINFQETKDTINYNYTFRGKVKRYIVLVEQYHYNVYVIKFYLAEHKNLNDKFNKLSMQNETSRVYS